MGSRESDKSQEYLVSMIRSYQDLKVWQEGMNLAQSCYQITQAFPREEMYGITSQIRRAATSIPANIAEGYGREYSSEYIRSLKISQGSLKELETYLLLAVRLQIGGIEAQKFNLLLQQCETVGRLLRGLIRALQNRESLNKTGN